MCFEIISQIIRRLEAAHIPREQVDELLPNIMQVTRKETLGEMQSLMSEAVESAICALCAATEAAPASLPSTQSMLTFIDQNCLRSDFSLQLLADHFHMSSPYLGKQFKAATGTTINKYVQSQRITQARKLLVDTEMTLAEIVEMTGYIDLSSFIKLFKQETGMTPIAYRKLYQ